MQGGVLYARMNDSSSLLVHSIYVGCEMRLCNIAKKIDSTFDSLN